MGQDGTNSENWHGDRAPARRDSNFQIPGTKPQVTSKTQNSKARPALPELFATWSLGLCLEPGIWALGFPLSPRHNGCSLFRVETAKTSVRKTESDPDIFFHCQHCKAALVANKSAAGMNLACQKCGQQTLVPQPEVPTSVSASFVEEIQRKLKENESQRAEITGYINQLTIQLHRWQLRLQTLNERKAQLEKDLGK